MVYTFDFLAVAVAIHKYYTVMDSITIHGALPGDVGPGLITREQVEGARIPGSQQRERGSQARASGSQLL